ncbi:MAG: PLP-dependent transferase, partial [Deinococcales bacterium]
HVENTRKLAAWLTQQPGVSNVNYPGLPGHPLHERALQHYPKGPGAILTFQVDGGVEAGKSFIDRLKLASNLVNLGDAKTSVTHPASTTHSQLDDAGLRAAGISPGLVRVSPGIEHIDDLLEDFGQALRAVRRPVPA